MNNNTVNQPLADARLWIMFSGIFLVLLGFFFVITVFGSIFGVVNIIMGWLLISASGRLRPAATEELTQQNFISAQKKLKIFFTIFGLVALLGVFMFLMMIAMGAGALTFLFSPLMENGFMNHQMNMWWK